LAEAAGFREFFAEVLSKNVRSQAVLNRLGFLLSEDKAGKPDKIVYRRRIKS